MAGLLLLGLLVSCGLAPSKGIEQQHIFSYTADVLGQFEQLPYSEGLRNRLLALYRQTPSILYVRRGQSLVFWQQAAQPRADTLLYSQGDGAYRLARDLYLSAAGKVRLLSLDGEQWYAISAKHTAGRHSNFILRSHFETAIEPQEVLSVRYRAEMALAPKLVPYQLKPKEMERPLRRGAAGDGILLSSRQAPGGSQNWIDLQQVILFFAQDTEFAYQFAVRGDLFTARTTGPKIALTFLRDVYFYYPHRFFAAISFDGRNWSPNYFQFRLGQRAWSTFATASTVLYREVLYLDYKGD